MAKKTKAPKQTKAKQPKAKKAKPEQLKIAGTGRLDANEEVEVAAEAYRDARDERMELSEAETDAQDVLTATLKKHGLTEYIYEDKAGIKRRAYIPAEAKAKVQKVKEKKAESFE